MNSKKYNHKIINDVLYSYNFKEAILDKLIENGMNLLDIEEKYYNNLYCDDFIYSIESNYLTIIQKKNNISLFACTFHIKNIFIILKNNIFYTCENFISFKDLSEKLFYYFNNDCIVESLVCLALIKYSTIYSLGTSTSVDESDFSLYK